MGSPVAHATGMLGAVLGPLDRGGDIHLIDRWDPGHALEVMSAYDIGGGTGASIFLSTLLDHPDFTPAHAANMERIGLGGAPVPVELGRRAEALGIKIIRAYGSTEHPSTTGSQFDDPADQRHTTDGPVLPGVELRLVDPIGVDVPVGEAGEILSRGPELCLGYTNPALNEAFDDDGWYHTGDIGMLDEDGCLTITDRVKDIIIRGGENLSAAEIENAISGGAGHRRGRRRGRTRRPPRRARLRRRAHARPTPIRSSSPTCSPTSRRPAWPVRSGPRSCASSPTSRAPPPARSARSTSAPTSVHRERLTPDLVHWCLAPVHQVDRVRRRRCGS